MNHDFFTSPHYKKVRAAFNRFLGEMPLRFKVHLKLTEQTSGSTNTTEIRLDEFAAELGITASRLTGLLIDLSVMKVIRYVSGNNRGASWVITLLVH